MLKFDRTLIVFVTANAFAPCAFLSEENALLLCRWVKVIE
jgi:hypothetical protein